MKVQLRLLDGRSRCHLAETVSVSLHGALLRVPESSVFRQGNEVEITNHLTGKCAHARVISAKQNEVSIELLIPQNIWGIVLPPEDWYRYIEAQSDETNRSTPNQTFLS